MKNKYNAAEDRAAIINAADADTFGFDCVGLIKGILWGWWWDIKYKSLLDANAHTPEQHPAGWEEISE